jgi:hypothetical protein
LRKVLLAVALTVGVAAFVVETGAHYAVELVNASLDAPPPDCWPDCLANQ